MFEGFTEKRIAANGIELFVRHSQTRNGPPLLLLHGYPQTSAMWDEVARACAADFEVICPDLRGYGRSDKPPTTRDHSPYSKRETARDLIALMQALGHDRFFIGAHDRGGRVAHRLALDHPDAVAALSILDIAPTREMYANTDADFARAYWHWFFLIQPYPLPEDMIGLDPDGYWKHKCFDVKDGPQPFAAEALKEYLSAFRDPAAIHASCEDYRAAYTIDIAHDDADQGRKLDMPLQVLWGSKGIIERCFDALALWRSRAENVTGKALPSGHYMAEEIPQQIHSEMLGFYKAHAGRI